MCRIQFGESKNEEKTDSHYSNVMEGLDLLSTSGLGALKVDHLKGILMAHQVNPQGKKEELRVQLRSLLDQKMCAGASEADVVAEMKRTTAAAAAARQVNDRPLVLPAPDEAAPVAPLAHAD